MTTYEPSPPDPRVTVWDKDGNEWEPCAGRGGVYYRNPDRTKGWTGTWPDLLLHHAPLTTERPTRPGDKLTAPEELDALPKGSIISTPCGRVIAIKTFTGPFAWRQPGTPGEHSADGVLHEHPRFVILRVGYNNPTTKSEEA